MPLSTRGAAAFHVRPLSSGQRFLLELPDGELEVHGTRFEVRVENGTTRHVGVREGVVALRLEGQTERILRAGEEYSAWQSVPTTEPVPSTSPPVSRQAVAPLPASAAPISPTAPVVPSANAGRDSAGSRFIEATGAFQSGSYARADTLLAAFIRDFPSDPRAEDAAFMRAMAHTQLGDRAGAATLARSYLKRFPNGLRREAERLANDEP